MQDSFEYVLRDNEVTIYRCYSQHTDIEIPGSIDGYPVTGIADHCFAREASFMYKKHEIRRMYGSDESDVILQDMQAGGQEEDAPLVSTNVTSLHLPPQLKRIGNYALYGCRDLKQIRFPESSFRLGSGVFVDCPHLQWLIFETHAADNAAGFATPPCMREILREIEYELETMLIDPEQDDKVYCRLYFPGYVEETIENTPARIVEMRYEGTGFKYRQCLNSGQIDFHLYDSGQYLMSVQENLYTSIPLTLDRLRTPVQLEDEWRDKYMTFLRKEYRYLANRLLSGVGELGVIDSSICYDAVSDLCAMGYFTEEIIGEFIEMAGEKNMPQIVSLLMNYRREHFAKKKKTYTF